MNKVIFLRDDRPAAASGPTVTPAVPAQGNGRAVAVPVAMPALDVRDRRGRPLKDLRISITDRCNFRCGYCMPRDVFDSAYTFMPQSALLSFEEITRTARVFARLGVEKIRLTGGEPLLRKNIEQLIEMLAEIRTPDGHPLELALTTNASLLARKARDLARAGLNRVTVSMDALDADRFAQMSDSRFTPTDVLRGIDAAAAEGLTPVKVNMVVRGGVNDDQILPMARQFRGTGHVLRFIEYMDVGSTNGWNMQEVVPSAEVIERLGAHYPVAPVEEPGLGRVARRWRYLDGGGEIGVISSVTEAFCGGCTRARLSPEGQLFLCLFAGEGHDLRAVIRGEHDDDALMRAVTQIWRGRNDNYSDRRAEVMSADDGQTADAPRRVEMSYIGG